MSIHLLGYSARLARPFAIVLLIISALGTWFTPSRPARAANFLITNLADSGPGSLRQAILNANASAGANTLTFDPLVVGIITLTTGELLITGDMTITGPGAAVLTVSGNNTSRVFNISNWLSTVSISGLTVANGKVVGQGGGIFNAGTLTVTDSALSNNSVGGGGGGLFNKNGGFLTVTNSTFNGNSAGGVGGGLINDAGGVLIMTNSTINGNSALNSGGGINNGGKTSIVSSTISGNSAANGGGVANFVGLNLKLKNSIVAGNTGPANPDIQGVVTGSGVNITTGDPGLLPLANNGGQTQTQALTDTSPARGAATDCTAIDGVTPITTDQRGGVRPTNLVCDVGAFQAAVALPTPTNAATLTPSLTSTPTLLASEPYLLITCTQTEVRGRFDRPLASNARVEISLGSNLSVKLASTVVPLEGESYSALLSYDPQPPKTHLVVTFGEWDGSEYVRPARIYGKDCLTPVQVAETTTAAASSTPVFGLFPRSAVTPYTTPAVFQFFEHGFMVWRADYNCVYAILTKGTALLNKTSVDAITTPACKVEKPHPPRQLGHFSIVIGVAQGMERKVGGDSLAFTECKVPIFRVPKSNVTQYKFCYV